MKFRLLVICAFSILVQFAPAIASCDELDKEIVFVSTRPENHELNQRLIKVYTEAFRRLGYKFVFLDVPAMRASEYSNNGRVDGELARIYSYGDTYRNLIRVEEPHFTSRYYAYAATDQISLQSLESLRNSDYRVDCRRGVLFCRESVLKVLPENHLTEVNSVKQAVQRLLNGWNDVYIANTRTIQPFLESDEYRKLSHERKLFRVGLMGEVSSHAYLHKKHANLVVPLNDVLLQMKSEGIFQKFIPE